MYQISQTGTEFEISNFPWDTNGYTPKTTVQISYDASGFHLCFTAYESEIRAVCTQHNTHICSDSCVEFFVQFDATNDQRYINFEINPNGAVYNAINVKRGDKCFMPESDIEMLNVCTSVLDDRWTVDFSVPLEYIHNYVPTYKHQPGSIIRCNFYKCGDDFKYPHYGCFANIDLENPDFHCPGFFAELQLV